ETRGGRHCHRVRTPAPQRSTAASRRSDGATPASVLWAPTSPALRAAVTPRIRPRTRSARAGAEPFFQLRPALGDPLLDGCLVALDRTSGWALPGPLQLVAQQIPHVSWVVADASQALDYFGRACQ